MNTVKLPKGWFMRDVAKAAKRAARWAALPARKSQAARRVAKEQSSGS